MKIKKITKIEHSSKRYDIQTGTSNFFANGILVHNSLLIISKYNGNFIYRTRGTVDARALNNGHEISIIEKQLNDSGFIAHYNDVCGETWNRSFLFEWTSPIQKIVINYGDTPTFKLIGIINHHDYSLESQNVLDEIAVEWNFDRPAMYDFPSIAAMLSDIENWKNKEGIVIYTHDDQALHKCKSPWYLSLHRLKSELSSTEKVIDVWLERNYPDYNTFFNYISVTFDFELADQISGQISKICDAYKEVLTIIAGMHVFVNRAKTLASRKEQAQYIIGAYGNTNRASFCFKILDGKELGPDDIKKLLFQVMKN